MITYRYAGMDDIDLLADLRLEFINLSKENENHSTLRQNLVDYFNEALTDNTCDAVLAESNGEVIGTGIIFYFNSVPSSFNLTGKNSRISCMYVKEAYRRHKIGTTILNKLIGTAKYRGCPTVILTASDVGKKLYEKYGFKDLENGMIFHI